MSRGVVAAAVAAVVFAVMALAEEAPYAHHAPLPPASGLLALTRCCAPCGRRSGPSAPGPTRCSAHVPDGRLANQVINITDGANKRCVAVVRPAAETAPVPVLFWFHGAGGSAANCGMAGSADAPHTTLGQLALAHGFALVCGEAIQWTPPGGPPPAPGPPGHVPADCLACFASHGCKPGAGCDECVVKRAQGPCTHICEPEHVPFPLAQHTFCKDHVDAAAASAAAPSLGGVCDSCHGGQWLIPDVQTTASGPKCAPGDSVENVYMANAIAALEAATHPGGGKVFDTTRVFTSGCSMGSAFSIFAANCLYSTLPKGTISAFATHSTGMKKKGDGLTFPPDNYNTEFKWGECPDCEWFPTVPRVQPGMHACVFDNSGDEIPGFGDFYNSSKAMVEIWTSLGNKVVGNFGTGGHCNIHSYESIVQCLDGGSNRLIHR